MKNLLDRMRDGETLVADGAMGTLLFERGLRRGECPESLNLTRPELLEEIARLYLEAGADIIQTNTFGGSRLKLDASGLGEKTEEINRAAVAAVRQAVGEWGSAYVGDPAGVSRPAYVSGSCGPSGRTLKPYGDADPDDVSRSFETQMRALVAAGVDALTIETMTDLHEAELAVKAARAISATIPIMATMTFEETPRGFYTIMGAGIAAAASGLAAAGADILGTNCGNGIEKMIAIAREFRRHTDLPLLVQSNAGLPRLEGEEIVYPETPAFMAEKARELLAAGVSIIGGCCGTTPEHIRALRRVVNSR